MLLVTTNDESSAFENRAQTNTTQNNEEENSNFENDERFSEKEKWALSYSYLMYKDPKKIDSSFYEKGKQFYTEAQIMEIGSFVALHYGLQVFMRTISLSSS